MPMKIPPQSIFSVTGLGLTPDYISVNESTSGGAVVLVRSLSGYVAAFEMTAEECRNLGSHLIRKFGAV